MIKIKLKINLLVYRYVFYIVRLVNCKLLALVNSTNCNYKAAFITIKIKQYYTK